MIKAYEYNQRFHKNPSGETFRKKVEYAQECIDLGIAKVETDIVKGRKMHSVIFREGDQVQKYHLPFGLLQF